MNYTERFRAFRTSESHRKGRRLILAIAVTHIVANFFDISRGRSVGAYATPDDVGIAVAYWCAFTVVWWLFVYIGWRLVMAMRRANPHDDR
jgi:hypothetical protein